MSPFAIVHAEKAWFPVLTLCTLLGVSTSGYYAWRDRPLSSRQRQEERLVTKMRAVQAHVRGVYGSPRMTAELNADGERVGVNRVARLMRENGLLARQRRRFCATTNSKHTLPIAPNLLARRTSWSEPNLAWVSDITYLRTKQGWAYLAVVIDLFSRRVVGWSVSDSLHREVALRALRSALDARRPAPGIIHHSDRGAQYASHDYRDLLLQNGAKQSMSRRANCWDNAVAESFFSSLKKECIRDQELADLHEARQVVADYIDGFYNCQFAASWDHPSG